MTDVQVSNARRWGFTAMAVFTLLVASSSAYSLSSEMPVHLYMWFGPEIANRVMANYLWTCLACGLLLALIPLAFLSGIDDKWFRVLTGLVGLVALLWLAVELREPFSSPTLGLPIAGWGGLVYACWIRSGRITRTALAFVLALGVCGMAISFFSLSAGGPPIPSGEIPMAIVFLTGIWILNGLGIVWIVQKVRRIRAASNTDAEDAAR